MATLIGLDHRERQDTLHGEAPASRSRPVVVREDADERIIEEYRREAARILGDGRLSSFDFSME